jgi:hypothetical protein
LGSGLPIGLPCLAAAFYDEKLVAALAGRILQLRAQGHVEDKPHEDEHDDDGGAARAEEGQGLAGHRQQVDHAEHVEEGLKAYYGRGRARHYAPVQVGGVAGDAVGREQKEQEQHDDRHRADEAKLLADYREDEVVVRLRQVEVLLV